MCPIHIGSLALWIGKPDARKPAETVMVTDVLPPRTPGEPPAAYEVRFLGSDQPQWVSPLSLVELAEEQ